MERSEKCSSWRRSSTNSSSLLVSCSGAPWVCSRKHRELLLISLKQSEKSALPAARTVSHDRPNRVWNSSPLRHLRAAKMSDWLRANEACSGWSGIWCVFLQPVVKRVEPVRSHQADLVWDATLKDIRDTRWDKTTFSGEKLAEIADSQHGFILWPRFNSTHSYRTAFFFFFSVSLSSVCLVWGALFKPERSVYFYMRAMKVYIALQLPKWARMWLLRVKF